MAMNAHGGHSGGEESDESACLCSTVILGTRRSEVIRVVEGRIVAVQHVEGENSYQRCAE
jgi:hypothetical protein